MPPWAATTETGPAASTRSPTAATIPTARVRRENDVAQRSKYTVVGNPISSSG